MKKQLLLACFLITYLQAYSQNWLRVGSGGPSHFANTNNEVIEFNGDMYSVGYVFNGIFNVPDAYTPKVFKLTAGLWSEAGSGFASSQTGLYTINAIAEYNSELYIGGNFVMDNGVDPVFNDVAKWDAANSRWIPAGDGTGDGVVNELTVFESKLYAGGDFGDLGAGGTNNIAVWAGASWAPVGTGTSVATNGSDDPDQISSMVIYNSELIVGGKFSTAGGILAHNVAKWDGTIWAYLKGDIVEGGGGVGGFNNGQVEVMSLQVFGSDLFIGGTFSTYYNFSYIGSSTPVSNHLVVWNGTSFSAPTKATPANNRVNAMTVFNGRIYIGNINESNIYSWDGGIFDWRLEPDRDPVRQRVTSFYSNGTDIFYTQTYGVFNLADPLPSFTINSDQACVDADVTFTDTSTGTNAITGWDWIFEGGTPATSTDPNPVVTYAAAGSFEVTLEVTSSDGTYTITTDDAVTVSDVFVVDAGPDITVAYPNVVALTGNESPTGGSWSGTGVVGASMNEFGTNGLTLNEVYDVTYLVIQGSCTVTDIVQVTANKGVYDDYDFSAIPIDLKWDGTDVVIELSYNSSYIYELVSGTGTFQGLSGLGVARLTITGAGSFELKVTQSATDLYNEKIDEFSFTVAKGDHTMAFNSIEDKPFGTSFTLGFGATSDITTTAPAGQPTGLVALSVISGPAEVDPTNAQGLTVTGVGTVTIQVDNEGNDSWNPAPAVQTTFNAVQAGQTISKNVPDEIPFSFDTYSFEGMVSTTASLPVNYIITSGPGSLSGDNLDKYNFTATGQVTISAFSSGNDLYESTPPVDIIFDVVKGDQTITFNGIDGTTDFSAIYKPEGFVLDAEASSGLDVSFTIVTGGSGTGTITGNTLDVTVSGGFSIKPGQSGDDNWNAASDIPQNIRNFTINKAEQTISFEEIPDKSKSDDPFPLVFSTSSGLDLFISSSQGKVTIENGTVTINTQAVAGREFITITQGGDENYIQAEVAMNFCISPAAPTISATGQGSNQLVLNSDNTVDGHEWRLDGTTLNNPPGPTHSYVVQEAGIYTAVALAQNDCPQSAESNELAIIITSIDQALNNGIRIYPNPVSNQLKVEISSDLGYKKVELSIFSLSGKLVSYPRILKTNRAMHVDVRDLDPGLYILQLRNESNVHQFRINKK